MTIHRNVTPFREGTGHAYDIRNPQSAIRIAASLGFAGIVHAADLKVTLRHKVGRPVKNAVIIVKAARTDLQRLGQATSQDQTVLSSSLRLSF